MADLLKNVYSHSFLEYNGQVLSQNLKDFDQQKWLIGIYQHDWDTLELKPRMLRIAQTTANYLPSDYTSIDSIINNWIVQLRKNGVSDQNFAYLFIPEIILMTIHDVGDAMRTIYTTTQFVSCEFVIRHYIMKDTTQVMKTLLLWSKDINENVRRLSSEGCRPRLPWGLQLTQFVKDPELIYPILDNLQEDASQYVRKSVANNINDISKDHPEQVVQWCEDRYGKHKDTDWIIKHGGRTLLKKGNARLLALFGHGHNDSISVQNSTIDKNKIYLGDRLSLSFVVQNDSPNTEPVRLEYNIYFMKANGSLSKKIFKISEKNIAGNSIQQVVKKHTFIDLTTRKHNHGRHQISVVCNGKEYERLDFTLEV